MAMTSSQKLDAYRFFAIAFDAAPGVTYFGQIADAYAAGWDTKKIVNVYTTKSQFTDMYPTTLTSSQFATKLVETVVAQNTTVAARAAAVADIVAALNVGWSRGDVVYQVFNNLANKPFTDPTWGSTAKLLDNEVLVAQYYTETALGNTTDLTTLQVVLNNVTSSSDVSSSSAIAALASPPHIFTLTESLVAGKAAVAPVYATYWGYNPHATTSSTIDNTGAAQGTYNVNQPGNNAANGVNEGPADGGIPVGDLVSFLTTITGLSFKQLGLIDASGQQSFANVTSLTLSNAISSSGGTATSGTTTGQTGASGSGDTTGASTTTPSTLTIGYADGTSMNAEVALGNDYLYFLNNLLFDAQGNTRLFQKVVSGGTSGTSSTLQPIKLTQTINNGGTIEQGYTNAGDDTIVAGRLELLHQAYIDGGPGYNILEVDAKGTYAQPAELLNIQEIRVNDLPNFYTNDYTPATGNAVSVGTNGGNLNNTAFNTNGFLSPTGSGSDDSWLDLSRGTAIKKLIVNDSGTLAAASGATDYSGYSGNLTIVGVRNGALLRLEGGFKSGATTIQYGQGQTGTFNLELAVGDVTAPINILQNSAVFSIDSQGVVNHMHSFFAGGSISRMYVKGTGEFAVDQNISPSFNQNTAVVIDATANTGGLNINFDAGSGGSDVNAGSNPAQRFASVTVNGTTVNDTIFVQNVKAYTGDQTASNNGATTLLNGKVTVNAGNGDNVVVTDGSSLVKVTTGTGDDTVFAKHGEVVTVVAGDGSNVINADGSLIVSVTTGTGDDNISVQAFGSGSEMVSPKTVTVAAGDGNNIINTSDSETVTITTGAGNDKITSVGNDTVVIDAGSGNNSIGVAAGSITITTSTGNDTITAKGASITINSAGGVDTIRLAGTYTGEGLDSTTGSPAGTGAFGTDSFATGNASDGSLLAVNTGATGSATIYFGNDQTADAPAWTHLLAGVTALDGSVIAGNNVKFYIDSPTNLAQADLTGLTGSTKVVVEAGDKLRITSDQFKTLGAAAFSEHLAGAGAQIGDIYIVVKAGVSFDLSAIDLAALSPNVKLHFELQEAANLTLTATQLHNYLADNAVTSVSGTNGQAAASANGIVTLTGAGATFTVGADGDGDRVFGTITEANVDNLIVTRVSTGFNRPADVATTDTYVIDSTGTAALVLTKAVSSIATALTITGNQDVDFTASSVKMGLTRSNTAPATYTTTSVNDYTIDWSKLTGKVIGLTIKEFDDAVSIAGNDTATNGFNTRVNVELAGNVGETGNLKGLTTSGVSQYVVTAINDTANNDADSLATTATFYLCDNSKDVKVIGLHGNGGNTVTFAQVPWGKVAPVILLEGDGYADWNGGLKVDLDPNVSNIGTVIVSFDALQGKSAAAVVNINNGGVALGVTSTGGERKFLVDGLKFENASSATINVTDGDVTITSLDDVAVTDTLASLKFVATEDVTIKGTLLQSLSTVNASGVVGKFTATLGDPGAHKIAFTGGAGGSALTLHGMLIDPATGANDNGSSINGGTGGADLTIETTSDLAAATLTNINTVTLLTGQQVTLTIAQATAIDIADIKVDAVGSAGILNLVGLDNTPFTVTALTKGMSIGTVTLASNPVITLDPTTNLTGVATLYVPDGTTLNLTAAQFQQLTNHTITGSNVVGSRGIVNITGLTQADIKPLDLNGDGDYTDAGEHAGFTLAGITGVKVGTITLAESVTLKSTDSFGTFTKIVMGNDMTLGLAEFEQGAGLKISGGTNTTLQFNDTTTATASIDASGYGVTTVKLLNLLVGGKNVDLMLDHLPSGVVKEIYNDLGWALKINQIATVDAGTTVPSGLVFNPITNDTELQTFTLNMSGGTEISGTLNLATTAKVVSSVQQMRTLLETLTINSTGTATNLLNGKTANVITGDISPLSYSGTTTDDNLLKVVINASQALSVKGDLVFSSVVGDDLYTGNDNDAAIASLTVNGTSNVSLGTVNTGDDDVDGLNVVNNSTGTLSLTLDAAKLDQVVGATPNNDALSFTGARIALTIDDSVAAVDAVDLSDDVLTGVSKITIGNGLTTGGLGGELILTQAQLIALGAANLVDDGLLANSAVLRLVAFGSAPFNATALDAKITVKSITLAAGTVTLDPTTNLTGVEELRVQEGSTVNMTAAQFQQLKGKGTIVGLDTNADTVFKSFTVNITDLKQADVQRAIDPLISGDTGGLDLTGITGGTGSNAPKVNVSLAETSVTLGKFSSAGVLSLASNLGAATNQVVKFVLADGQTLSLVNSTQADGLIVAGGANSTLVLKFDSLVVPNSQIDASGYNVTTLKALATFVDGENVEFLLKSVASSIQERYYTDPLQLGLVKSTDRVVVVEAGVNVGGYVMYNDLQTTQEVRNLDLTLSGGSKITGDLNLATTTKVNSPVLTQQYFDTLTIHSVGTGSNSITGNIIATAASAPDVNGSAAGAGTIAAAENNLLKVVIDATQPLVIGVFDPTTGAYTSGGNIVFTSVTDAAGAALTITGTAAVTVHGLDVSDNTDNTITSTPANEPDVSTLTITNNSTGTFTATGGTPAITGLITNLVLKGTGAMAFGTNAPGGVVNTEGVTSSTLSSIDASGLSGALNLGVVNDVNTQGFTFTAGTGATKLTLTADTLDSDLGTLATPKSATWAFNFGTAGVGSEFHINDVTANAFGNAADLANIYTSNGLNISLGANTTLYIDADTDFTMLDSFALTGSGAHSIVLKDGKTLKLTAAQANGLHIIAGPDDITNGVGISAKVNIIDLGTAPVDFSGIAADISGTVSLKVTDPTVDLLAADVTLPVATNLGDFTVQLVVRDLGDGTLIGQTVRYNTVAQADNPVSVVGHGIMAGYPAAITAGDITADTAGTSANSTNVVWLFNTLTAPVDTSKYSADLGRLLFTTALVNAYGGLVENMFTTLPSTVLRVDFASVTALNILLTSAQVDRTMEFSSFTTTGNLTYSDIGISPVEHLHSLKLVLGGQATIGNVLIDDVIPAAGYNPIVQFTTLTVESHLALTGRTAASAALVGGNPTPNYLASEAYVNNNNGVSDPSSTPGVSLESTQPNNINTVGNIGVGSVNGLDLLNVSLNTFGLSVRDDTSAGDGAKLNVGTITYGYVPTVALPTTTALLRVLGVNDINVTSVAVLDTDLTALTVNSAGFTGVLTAPGASPGVQLGASVETLTFTNGDATSSTITLGSATHGGVAGSALSTINATAFDGTLNLGTLETVDGTDDDLNGDGDLADAGEHIAFTFNSGTGVTSLTLGTADGVHPTLATGSTWDFDFTTGGGADAGSVMTIVGTTPNIFSPQSNLRIELGNAALNIVGDVDFTTLVDDPLTAAVTGSLVITGGVINVAAGQSLTLTVAQALALTTDIVGPGTVRIVGDATLVNGVTLGQHLKTAALDFSAVTLTAPTDTVFDVTLPDAMSIAFPLASPPVTSAAIASTSILGTALNDSITLTGTKNKSVTPGVGDDTVTDTTNPGSTTFNVTSGTDTIVGLTGVTALTAGTVHDALVVSAGATANAAVSSLVSAGVYGFIATAATVNAGTVTLTASGVAGSADTTIDMHLAGGTKGFNLIGGTSATVGHHTLIGSNQADVINGGSVTQTAAAATDTLTGNGGADTFEFSISTSTPATEAVAVSAPAGIDVETIAVNVSGVNTGGNDVLRINYTLNGNAAFVLTNPIVDLSSTSEVLTAISNALLGLPGVTSSNTPTLITAFGDGSNSFEVLPGGITVNSGTGTVPTFTLADTGDIASVQTLTLSGTVTIGEKYTVSISLVEGGSINAEFIAVTSALSDVAAGIAAEFNLLAAAGTVDASSVGAVVTFLDENSDNGGFTLSAGAIGTVNGTGASALGAPTLATADLITDFASGVDRIDLNVVAGSATNLVKVVQTADYATALAAANAAIDGLTVKYYLTSLADNTETAAVNDATGLLFFDANGDGTADGVVALTGINSTNFAFTDIIA